jgi:hypothetical protein
MGAGDVISLLWSDSSWSWGLREEPSPGKYDWLIVSPVLRVLNQQLRQSTGRKAQMRP